MPHKLPFRVAHVTSQDENFPASELNHHSPSTRGWVSSRFSVYPQQVVFALDEKVRIRKIQVLCHQYLIASKIEFFVGDTVEDEAKHYQNARYTRLGYVALSENTNTEFKARELKSVHVDATGTYVQLLMHTNYRNKHNAYNQVSLIAVNLIGDSIRKSNSLETDESSSLQRPDFIAPTEDLAFDIYQDPEVANIIRRLERQKLTAVTHERFDQAQKIRDAISYLQRVGERLGRLSLEKQQAVQEENYERAKVKKFQMKELRANLHRDLDLINLFSDQPVEAVETNGDGSNYPEPSRIGRPPPVRLTTLAEAIDSNKKVPDDEFTAKESVVTTNNSTATTTTITIPIPATTKKSSPRRRRPNALADPDDRPLPALKPQSQRNNNSVVINESPPSRMEVLPAEPATHVDVVYRSQTPPRVQFVVDQPCHMPMCREFEELRELDEVEDTLNGNEDELPYDMMVEGPAPGEVPDLPEPLNESQRRQASVAIDVVGIAMVTKAMSKSWAFREKALLELEQRVTAAKLPAPAFAPDLSNPDPRVELRSTAFLLRKALQDQVLSIFRLATYFIKGTIVDFADRHDIPRAELHYALDKLVPILFHRTGDTSVRIREVVKAQILAMAQWPSLRHSTTFWNELVRPFSPVTLDRLSLSRVELVTELYASRGIDPPEHTSGHGGPQAGFSLEAVAAFTAKALTHRLNEVRDAAENLMIALYRAEDRAIIRRTMPPDDMIAKKHPLYRRLFGKFDRIDEKYAPAPAIAAALKHGLAVPDAGKKRRELEALQAEVQQLRSIMNHEDRGRTSAATRRFRNATERVIASRGRQSRPAEKSSSQHTSVSPRNNKTVSLGNPPIGRASPSPVVPSAGDADVLLNLDKTCIFCGDQNETFTEEGLDLHYWKDCAMLHRCLNCKQVVEIAGMTEHLLNECESIQKGQYYRCNRCCEAVLKNERATHNCIPCSLNGLRCPLCHSDLPLQNSGAVAPGGPEDLWRSHLLGLDQNNMPVCPENPRRFVRTVAAIHVGSKGRQSPLKPSTVSGLKINRPTDSVRGRSASKNRSYIPRPTQL